MLSQIHIKNFALIDDLSIEPGPGLNVLTGETGAGKSIIIDALTTVLGERLSSDFIRTGADKATVEAVFDLSDDRDAAARAEEFGIDTSDDVLIISRELTSAGKSQTRVNGRISTVSVIKELTSGLIDIHGQHEHQSLLAIDKHLEMLDQWCGEKIVDLRAEVSQLYDQMHKLMGELEQLRRNERERTRLVDLYGFQKTEIEGANLKPGEDEDLLAERSRLANAEKLYEMASQAYTAIGGSTEENGAVDSLASAHVQIQSMAHLDENLEAMVQDIETALYAAEQVQSAVREYRDSIEFNPGRLEDVEERLDLIRTLKRKYGDTIEDILNYGRDVAEKLNDLMHSEERTAELESEIAAVKAQFMARAEQLSAVRQEAATEFSMELETHLVDLAMGSTKFEVEFEKSEPTPTGIDRVEFLISPNPGEPLKPLAKIASGGELSRIMLALKTVMAGADEVPTLIFDEIDTGIGGRTAQVLGQKLASVAKTAQVMCVTHLPQIASFGTSHFFIKKQVEGDRTVVSVRRVEGDARVDEIARMLGGAEDSTTAHNHAKEMLEAASR